MRQRITLKKIAKEFGVSISTVSKALKDSHEIGEETKEKIKAFASYYNYKPNSLALQLRNKKSSVIGVIVPEIVHHFFSTVINGIEHYASKKGYTVMVCASNESYEREVSNVSVLTDGKVDGLIVSITRETNNYKHLQNLINDEFPLVLFDREVDELECDKIIIDDKGGAFQATNHLIDIGCKKIALITTKNTIKVSKLREEGFKKALKKAGIKETLIYRIDDEEDLHNQIKEKIFTNNLPDGILAVNEVYAATALQIANQKKIAVPKNIAIIGFTSGLISKFTQPPLTCIKQHAHLMGMQAAELLINRINQKEPTKFKKEVISTNLIIRQSTKKPN